MNISTLVRSSPKSLIMSLWRILALTIFRMSILVGVASTMNLLENIAIAKPPFDKKIVRLPVSRKLVDVAREEHDRVRIIAERVRLNAERERACISAKRELIIAAPLKPEIVEDKNVKTAHSLLRAIKNKNLAAVQTILKESDFVDYVSLNWPGLLVPPFIIEIHSVYFEKKGSKSLFEFAAEYGNRLIMIELESVFDIDMISFRNSSGETLLCHATKNLDTFSWLFERGLDFKSSNCCGGINLLERILDTYDFSILRYLREKGMNFNEPMGTIVSPLLFALSKRRYGLLKELLTFPEIDVNQRGDFDNSSLHFAARGDERILAQILTHPDIDINAVNTNGETPLLYALKSRSIWGADPIKNIEALLNKSETNIHIADLDGMTPFKMAITNKLWKIVSMILPKIYQADILDLDLNWNSLFLELFHEKEIEIFLNLLEKIGPAPEDLIDFDPNRILSLIMNSATYWSDVRFFSAILAMPMIDLNARDSLGQTLLYKAIKLKNKALVEELLKYDRKAFLGDPSSASTDEFFEAGEKALSEGRIIDINLVNPQDGLRSLDLAIKNGLFWEVARFLHFTSEEDILRNITDLEKASKSFDYFTKLPFTVKNAQMAFRIQRQALSNGILTTKSQFIQTVTSLGLVSSRALETRLEYFSFLKDVVEVMNSIFSLNKDDIIKLKTFVAEFYRGWSEIELSRISEEEKDARNEVVRLFSDLEHEPFHPRWEKSINAFEVWTKKQKLLLSKKALNQTTYQFELLKPSRGEEDIPGLISPSNRAMGGAGAEPLECIACTEAIDAEHPGWKCPHEHLNHPERNFPIHLGQCMGNHIRGWMDRSEAGEAEMPVKCLHPSSAHELHFTRKQLQSFGLSMLEIDRVLQKTYVAYGCELERLKKLGTKAARKPPLPVFVHCLSPDCPHLVPVESINKEDSSYLCEACNVSSCSLCTSLAHPGFECKETVSDPYMEEVIAKGKLAPKFDDPLAGANRRCPNCNILTNRTFGCNGMKCASCKVDWHWNKGLPPFKDQVESYRIQHDSINDKQVYDIEKEINARLVRRIKFKKKLSGWKKFAAKFICH